MSWYHIYHYQSSQCYVLSVLNVYVFLDWQSRHIQCDCSRPRDRRSGRSDSGEHVPNSRAPERRALHLGPTCAGGTGHHRRPSWALALLWCRRQLVPILVWFHSWEFSALWLVVFVSTHTVTALAKTSLPILLNLFDVPCHFNLNALRQAEIIK